MSDAVNRFPSGWDEAGPVFVSDFVAAWHKVMNLDRYDVG